MKFSLASTARSWAVMLLSTTSAFAGLQSVSRLIVLRPTPWTDTVSIPRFNTSPGTTLGTLQQVRVEVRDTLRGRLGFENQGNVAATGSVALQARAVVNGPGGFTSSTTASTTIMVSAQPYDGHLDYVGSSGSTLLNQFGRETTVTDASQIASWMGPTGSPDVTLTIQAANTTPTTAQTPTGGPLRLLSRVSCDVLITVTYVYDPIADCDQDGIADADETDSDQDGYPDDCDTEPAASSGEPGYARPGSLLVQPLVSGASDGNVSLVSFTNTSAAPVRLSIVRVAPGDGSCQTATVEMTLGPFDTTARLGPSFGLSSPAGYAYAFAVDTSSGVPIARNVLVGSTLFLSGLTSYVYRTSALAFRALGAEGTPTDLDANDVLALDGVEYEAAPAELEFPRFQAQSQVYSSFLVLINLTAGIQASSVGNVTIYNDSAEFFSAQVSFECWASRSLGSISSAFTQIFLDTTNDNPFEILGDESRDAGWFRVSGQVATTREGSVSNPALLGVLLESSNGRSACELPFYIGTRVNGAFAPPPPPIPLQGGGSGN